MSQCKNQSCQAVFSNVSKFKQLEDDEIEWICEFCGETNTLELNPEEVRTFPFLTIPS